MSKMVLCGFAAAWFFAASPTRRSSSVKATYDGVIRLPVESTLLVRGHVSFGARQAELSWGALGHTLIVDHNLDLAFLHHTDTRVGGAQILRSTWSIAVVVDEGSC